MRKAIFLTGLCIALLNTPALAENGLNRAGEAVGETAGKAMDGTRRVYERSTNAVEKGLNTASEHVGRALGHVEKGVRDFAEGVEEGLRRER
ncbi:hypothetical protein [Alkalilimnicola sp. S0819]|uniref:hypothetical protein n=1 Tax=Alkalilimnicola sp. S0819 TaxID=2613922 RepID=UPI0012626BF8|nr:hypothetical protein [Alkalilimnicola sp. S0819]KAB7623940.1 hypothetical protein F3N43_07795 [Alkalilimnicola sp. S0819]MPQ16538.1 hypothetical protein [Alkalilimnicola sp. S0819]